MSNHYYNTNYEPTITTEQAFDPEFQSTFSDDSSAGDKSSGGGFGGAFSKNFGKSFLDMWKSGNSGSSSSSKGDKNVFNPGTMGGGSISPIGDKGKHFLFQYTHPQATIMPTAPSQPGLGEKLLTTAAGAAVNAGVGAMFACDERVKVDMAPLESTEVNDSLAEIAFFVKGLRECA
jgi:hypothetical protein